MSHSSHRPRRARFGRRPSFGLTVPVALTLLLAASPLSVPTGPAGTPGGAALANADGCADVMVVGADGNAETPADGATFGRTLETLYREYTVRATGSPWSVAATRVAFDSHPVRDIKRTPDATGPAEKVVTRTSVNRWRSGYGNALRGTLDALQELAIRCPSQQLVLAGYAQGASAIHRALLRLDARSISRRVTAVVLVGDGDRARRTRAILRGAPRAARTGAGAVWLRAGQATDLPLSGSTTPVWQVCTSGDVVCDLNRTKVGAAMARHSRYHRGDGATLLQSVAGQLWSRTIRHPKPSVDPFLVDAEVGKALHVELPVDIRPQSLPFVRWRTGATLPPGLLLDSRGVLGGTPTQTADWTVRYTVRNTESAEFADPVRGTLKIAVAPSATGAVTAGGGQTCAVRADQTLWCWGRNDYGQLGNGTLTRSAVPVQVGSAAVWRSVTTDGASSCAVRVTGSLWCWGLNYRGQLGLGDTTKRKVPRRVGTESSWVTVSNSYFHTCATKTDGSLWCWGFNRDGQVGDGTTRTRTTPVRVGSGADWVTVSAGGWHTCATKTDGSLWCWGDNAFGQLGTGDRTSVRTPVQISPGSAWTSISAGWLHSCGVLSSGAARCWGRNAGGQLGDGSTTARRSPNPVAGSIVFTAVSTGESSSCGLATDGTTYCWGPNEYGQLGDGTTTNRTSPTPVLLPEGAVGLDVGWVHACAVGARGAPMCWGSNEDGQLGNGSYADASLPRRAG